MDQSVFRVPRALLKSDGKNCLYYLKMLPLNCCCISVISHFKPASRDQARASLLDGLGSPRSRPNRGSSPEDVERDSEVDHHRRRRRRWSGAVALFELKMHKSWNISALLSPDPVWIVWVSIFSFLESIDSFWLIQLMWQFTTIYNVTLSG